MFQKNRVDNKKIVETTTQDWVETLEGMFFFYFFGCWLLFYFVSASPTWSRSFRGPRCDFLFHCLPFRKGHLDGCPRIIWIAQTIMTSHTLVGGFNPFEKYQSNWIISPGRGENEKYLKPPPRYIYLVPSTNAPLRSPILYSEPSISMLGDRISSETMSVFVGV